VNDYAVVSLGISKNYVGDSKGVRKEILFEKGLYRLENNIKRFGYDFIGWGKKEWPEGCPTMHQCPYGFKIWCINEAWKQGYKYVIWADSSLVLEKNFLDKSFNEIKQDGYFFLTTNKHEFKCSEYTLTKLSINKHIVFDCRLIAGFFGLSKEHPKSKIFFNTMQKLIKDGTVFRGTNVEPFDLLASYKNHRHDQAVMRLLIEKFNMKTHLFQTGLKADHKFVKKG